MHDVTTWLTNKAIHILPNTSRSKDNQATKFGQLIEYNMRNVFVKKTNFLSKKHFLSKKSKLSLSQDQ